MSAIVVEDCDCGLIAKGHAFKGLRIAKFVNELAACRAWLQCDAIWKRAWGGDRPAIERYFAIHVPRGHVIGVRL